MEKIIYLLLITLFFILIFINMYQVNNFFNVLKQSHKQIWEKLGKPKWQIHFGRKDFQEAIKYIRQKKFIVLNDTVLDDLYKKIKLSERAMLITAIIIILFTSVSIFLDNAH